jgi:hypothetical protein
MNGMSDDTLADITAALTTDERAALVNGADTWSTTATEVLFPFGSGRGYTTWVLESATATLGSADALVTFGDDRGSRAVVGITRVEGVAGELAQVTVPVAHRLLQRWDDEKNTWVDREILGFVVASDIETVLGEVEGSLA